MRLPTHKSSKYLQADFYIYNCLIFECPYEPFMWQNQLIEQIFFIKEHGIGYSNLEFDQIKAKKDQHSVLTFTCLK